MTDSHSNKAQKRQAIFLALASIPPGKVVSYGQLAHLAGLPGGARQVGKALGDLPEGTQLPWFRVINAQGRISFPLDSTAYCLQKQKLEAEGVIFKNNKISLRDFGFIHSLT